MGRRGDRQRRNRRRRGALLGIALIACAAAAAPAQASTTIDFTFNSTGAAQYWTVPGNVSSANFDLLGGSGGTSGAFNPQAGGLGGEATGQLVLTPGSTLQVNVGGAGGQGTAGFNGGGSGPGTAFGPATGLGGGGGGTDIRDGGYGLSDRLLVAGGGGGGGSVSNSSHSAAGGAGGGLTGDGGSGDSFDAGGGGGTQTAGGTGPGNGCGGTSGIAGSFGQGGNAVVLNGGAGGGGGWYGGGSGSSGCSGGGGGGGSGYAGSSVTSPTLTKGVNSGGGKVTISYTGDILPTVTVNSSGSPALLGSVTYTATIAGLPTSPTVTSVGTVTFSDGGVAIPTCTNVAVSNLTATCTLTYNTAGIHTITAATTGDTSQSVDASGSAAIVQQVYTDSTTFSYTGASQTWTVPAYTTSAYFQAFGAAGGPNVPFIGTAPGGEGAGLLSLTAGSTLQINVGGAGGEPTAGWNGGAAGSDCDGCEGGGGGGGASDVRSGGNALSDRLIVGGGGGGAGDHNGGGVGGGTTGGNVFAAFNDTGGQGGTQTAGGAGGQTVGCFPTASGSNGSFGNGGGIDQVYGDQSDGGGGGGWYGGGGGAACGADGTGGGGGSGYVDPSAAYGSLTSGVQGGNGQVVVWYDRATQSISFAAPSGVTYGAADFGPGATASSGLPVSYSTTTPNVCTIVSGKLHIAGGGSCTIDADQAGDSNYLAAAEVQRTFTISKGSQSITFTAPSGVTYSSADFDPGATASSGLPVSYSTTTPSVCTIVSGKLHVAGVGSCTVNADQGGNGNYNAAAEIQQTFTIAPGDQAITFTAPSGARYGDADFDPGATASSGLPVSYSSTTPGVCTIVSGKLHAVSPGSCTIDADQAGNGSFNAASEVEQTFTIGQGNQTIAFTAPAGVTYGGADFDLSASATSGLPVSYTTTTPSGCTIVSGELHVVGAGTCTVDADQAGDGNWNAAPEVQQTFTIAPADQTITFAAPSGGVYRQADFDPGATASSGLPVSYSTTTPSVCTIVSGKLHVAGAGSCTVNADQPGDGNYNAAPEIQQTFTIAQADQTITFDAQTGVTAASADFDPGASASSGLPVSYATTTPSVCTIVSGKLHVNGAGSCTIDADQAGDGNYNAAPEVQQTFTIAVGDQTITFTAPSGVVYGQADFDLGATASSGLPVSYSSETASVCTIVSGLVHVVAAGSCTVDADQPGDGNFNAAPEAQQTFTIAPADQTITFDAPTGVTYTSADFYPGATASSGLPVSYSTTTSSVCTIVSGELHVVSAGSCTVDADQAGNANVKPAPEVEQTFTIFRSAQTITFPALSGVTYGTPDFDPAATASSGLPVSYSSTTPDVCTIVSNQVHIVSLGSCTVYAGQSGDGNFIGAEQVQQTFTVGQGDQSIAFTTPTGVTPAMADFDPGATASSGLPVTYTSTTPSVCTIVANLIHVVSKGSCTVDADQAGDSNWNPAPTVQQTFTIAKGAQTITFTTPSGATYGDGDSDPGATASSGLPVSYSTTTPSVCTIVSGQLHVVSAGSCTVDADQAGDSNWNAAPTNEQTFTISKADQTITFAPPGPTYGDPDSDPGATASSGLAVTYTSTTPSVCTIVSNELHVVSAGSCTIDADQAGDSNWNAALTNEQTFTINKKLVHIDANPVSREYRSPDPTLSWTLRASDFVGTDTADTSGVTGSASCTDRFASIRNNFGLLVNVGTYSVAIFCQPGSLSAPNYSFTLGSVGTLTVNPADQTITFTPPTGVIPAAGSLDPGATASSGLPVTYTSTTPDVCTIVSNQIHVVSLGSCTVDADQAGGGNWNPAPEVQGTFTFGIGDQTITFNPPSGITILSSDFDPGATADSGLPVTYSSTTPDVCTIVSNQIHVVSLGSCTVDADQPGNAAFNPAATVEQTFTIDKASQSISAPRIQTVFYGPDFDPGATTSSGLPISYSTLNANVCTIVNGKLHLVSAGRALCAVLADQAGDGTYDPAPETEMLFRILKGNQSITFPAPSGVTTSSPHFDPGATASSGLPVSYGSSTPNVCTIANGHVHVVSAGPCTIAADQAGDGNWNAAPEVQDTFTITPLPPHHTAAPAISGTAQEGQYLKADRGSWASTDTLTYSYQWQRCDTSGNNCVDLASTNPAYYYKLTSADVGHTIEVTVTATDEFGQSDQATSLPTSRVAAPPAPSNSALPAISGTARDGQSLKVSVGSWTSPDTLSYGYQWQRCDSAGNNCVNVASSSPAYYYKLTSADVGHTIQATVTATDQENQSTAKTSTATGVIAAPSAPANSALPTISGLLQSGQSLKAGPGSWTSPDTLSYAYQWQRCNSSGNNCVNVSAAGPAYYYKLTNADIGHTIQVVVTATDQENQSTPETASTTGVIASPSAPANRALPTITGLPQDGQFLKAAVGSWSSPDTLSYAYQWQRCDSAGNNCANVPSYSPAYYYKLTNADIGHTIQVVVTATDQENQSTPETSAPTGVIASPSAPANRALPTITGLLQDGQSLKVSLGTWTSPDTLAYTYQWQRCDSAGNNCLDVAAANPAYYYKLTNADVGHTIQATVTATDQENQSTPETSATTGVIAPPAAPANSALPTITGTPQNGQYLKASRGSWSSPDTLSYSYEWQRCDSSGNNCVDVPGYNPAYYYKLTAADVGHTIQATVTATDQESQSGHATSTTTAPIS